MVRRHDLRCTYATLLPVKGVRAESVSERLGDASTTITLTSAEGEDGSATPSSAPAAVGDAPPPAPRRARAPATAVALRPVGAARVSLATPADLAGHDTGRAHACGRGCHAPAAHSCPGVIEKQDG